MTCHSVFFIQLLETRGDNDMFVSEPSPSSVVQGTGLDPFPPRRAVSSRAAPAEGVKVLEVLQNVTKPGAPVAPRLQEGPWWCCQPHSLRLLQHLGRWQMQVSLLHLAAACWRNFVVVHICSC